MLSFPATNQLDNDVDKVLGFPSMSAIFDATGQYRYWLGREWEQTAPRVGFVMLNPSRADAVVDDPTIRRCVGFARSWGYGSLEVVNLFAYRSPSPKILNQVSDPVGQENDRTLQAFGQRVDRIILAWGNWGKLQERDRAVLELFNSSLLYCLGITKLGQPCHPLYLKADLQPIRFRSPRKVHA